MYTITLAKQTDHEFKIELPFDNKHDFKQARYKFKKTHYPDRPLNSPCWEFYLQFLNDNISKLGIDYIKPCKARDLDYFVRVYGEEKGRQKYDHRIKMDKHKNTLSGFIERYGKEKGTNKYYEKNKRLSVSYKALKLNGYSDKEIEDIKFKHSENSKSVSKVAMIKRYGEEDGLKRYNEYINNNIVTTFNVKYWINKGYSIDEAKCIISKRARHDLKYYIDRYGKEDGERKYIEYNRKKIRRGGSVSKLEINVLNILSEKYDTIHTKGINYNNKMYFVDIYIPSLNTVVEVFGDYWHCNPIMWNEYDYNKSLKIFAKDKWLSDKKRINNIKSLGYNVVILWESDIINNKKEYIYESCANKKGRK